ncbi:helix-turn-helix domain-containing protein [Saccharomonospora sp. NPDC006951]
MYEEVAPPVRLAGAVRCLWHARLEGPKPIIPDGCLDLMVAGERVFVAGPDTATWHTGEAEGPVVHGIRFRPGHAPRVLGVAADELTNQRVSLAELWGTHGARTAERLVSRPGLLAEVVAGRLASSGSDPALDLMIRRFDHGVTRVGAAMAGLAGSERQLRRRFTSAVGYGPATYVRIARLRRAITLAGASGRRGLSALAVEAGYADQAHLARDCRELTGSTPRDFFRTRRSALADSGR